MLAIAHNIGITRYSRYQFAYTLLPDFVAIWLALEAILFGASWWSRFHTSRTRHALGVADDEKSESTALPAPR